MAIKLKNRTKCPVGYQPTFAQGTSRPNFYFYFFFKFLHLTISPLDQHLVMKYGDDRWKFSWAIVQNVEMQSPEEGTDMKAPFENSNKKELF